MVYDDVLLVHAAEAVPAIGVFFLYVFVPEPEAHVTYDDVVRIYLERVVRDADTVARCGLSGDGNVAVLQVERCLEVDCSGHVEHYCACSSLLASPAE